MTVASQGQQFKEVKVRQFSNKPHIFFIYVDNFRIFLNLVLVKALRFVNVYIQKDDQLFWNKSGLYRVFFSNVRVLRNQIAFGAQ